MPMDACLLTDTQHQAPSPDTNHPEIPCDVVETGTSAQQPRKRRRVSRAGQLQRRSSRAGKLRHLPEMPLDILFEIFGHLDPSDVLHLARTTKALRGILMSKSSRFIWKQARSNLEGFPDCPPDLSEPQYANLAFDPHCHYCQYPHTPRILWACRVRCCKTCLSEEFVPEYRLPMTLELPPSPSRFLPFIYHQPLRRRGELYSLKQARELAEEYVDVLFNALSCEEWKNSKQQALRDINAHASLCERWHRKWTTNRSQELDTIRQRRKEAIFDKLRELGWGTELHKLLAYDPRALSDHALVKQPKELTLRIWNNIMPKLISFLEDMKAKRLKRERVAAINDRCRVMDTILDEFILTQPLTEVFPSIADVCEMREVKAVIEDTPIEVTVTKDNFADVAAQLPWLCHGWRASKDLELIAMMNEGSEDFLKIEEDEDSTFDTSRLKLATTWFSCHSCQEPISYPRVLAHSHAIAVDFMTRRGDEPDTLVTLNCDRWNRRGDRIKFHNRAHQEAKKIVKACGLNPDVVTADELNEVDPMLECLACRNNDNGGSLSGSSKLVMRWRRAVYHSVVDHGEETTTSWAILDEEARMQAEMLEKTEYSSLLPDLACVHCRSKTSLQSVKYHVKIRHGKEPTNIDYFFHIDASIHSIPAPVKIPILSSGIQELITSSISALECRNKMEDMLH